MSTDSSAARASTAAPKVASFGHRREVQRVVHVHQPVDARRPEQVRADATTCRALNRASENPPSESAIATHSNPAFDTAPNPATHRAAGPASAVAELHEILELVDRLGEQDACRARQSRESPRSRRRSTAVWLADACAPAAVRPARYNTTRRPCRGQAPRDLDDARPSSGLNPST